MFCLRAPTDSAWATTAVQDLDAVLVDHAHCEMKAATNALSLVVRHSSDLGLVRALTEIAREELEHFQRVVDFLEARGLRLGPPPVDDYAAELRRAMNRIRRSPAPLDGVEGGPRRSGEGRTGVNALPASELPLVTDRLLVGALIEARSCERFKLLIQVLPPSCPPDLRAFYDELFACEARHYRQYVDLAMRSAGALADQVEGRLALLAEAEARIVRSLAQRDERGTVHG